MGAANVIDYMLTHNKGARWDIVANAMRVMEQGMKKKTEDLVWRGLLGEEFYLGLRPKRQLLENIRCQWRTR